jgi:P27 family predicted phage terminase small subunit
MRGRKPRPTHLKVLDGNPGRRPLNPGEPKPQVKVPTCPAHLSPSAKAEWKRLARILYTLRIFTELDRAALAAYCQAYGRWVEAEKKLKETPALLKMPSGYVQQNPWLTISNKQLELMHRYISDLGLSPAARTRVDIRPFVPNEFEGLIGGQPSKFAGLLGPARPWLPADNYLPARRG